MPARAIANRSRVVGSCRSNIEYTRSVTPGGASTKTTAASTGAAANNRKSFSTRSRLTPTPRADPRAAGERQRQRDHQGGKDERCPHAVVGLEQQPGSGQADHQHQQPRVGHVVAHRSLRSLTEVVVLENAVLHDTEHRGARTDGDDDRGHRGLPTVREPADRRGARPGTAAPLWSRGGSRQDRSRRPQRSS